MDQTQHSGPISLSALEAAIRASWARDTSDDPGNWTPEEDLLGKHLALPVDGDPLGLGGPRDFNGAALEAGQAVVVGDLGLVPEEQGETVQWRPLEAARRQLPDVGEADRTLRGALLGAAGDLADLDVARWRPDPADHGAAPRLPPVAAGGAGDF